MTIRRALLSVSNKTGLIELARALAARDVALLSTGGTYQALAAAGVPVETVESYTGSPEVMAGRVKTLHPRIHGALLARAGIDDSDLERIGARPIDLVVVNLYPFEATLAKPDASFAELIENIDIGGPSMLRSAAKNHERVAVVCDPADYSIVLEEIERSGDVSAETRQRLAAKVFSHTAAYDAQIAGWLSARGEADGWPRTKSLSLEKAYALRYGENPHQKAAFYRERGALPGTLAQAESIGGGAKELSFNNLVDADAALEAVREFSEPAAVVIKHTNPCGVATASSLAAAYLSAREADAMSAFGGIVALNRPVDLATGKLLAETFLECVVAPSFDPAALELLRAKKALRLLSVGELTPAEQPETQYKRISGGFLAQDRDATAGREVVSGKVVTRRAPTADELSALEFAWKVCKHVKSNAIVLAGRNAEGGHVTLGVGAGQMARVTSVEIACKKAGDGARGAVLASDAFFPFPDGVESAAAAGVRAVAQPGGSKKDDDVVAAADRLGLAMVFTGVRHFRH